MIKILLLAFMYTSLFSQLIEEPLLKKIELKYGPYAKNRFVYLNTTMEDLKGKSLETQLNTVNRFFNDVRYGMDIKVYKVSDYWATPFEFLSRDRGDCEDYVIAKYYALRYLGIPAEKMYFTYVKSTRFKAPHMVLTYFDSTSSEPLVLDNTNFKIFPASQRPDLIPIYNFNADVLFKSKKKNTQGKLKNPKTHKKWDDLMNNIKREKI